MSTEHDEQLDRLDEFRRLRGAERDVALMDVEREIRRLTAEQASLVHEVATTLSYVDDCHRSPQAWLQAVTNSSRGAAVSVVLNGAMFAGLPELGAAALAGDLGPDQVTLFRRLWRNDRCREHLAGSLDLLLGAARALTLRDFRLVCQRWEQHADPDGAHREHQICRDNRHVTSSPLGDGHVMNVAGDALTGAMIDEILDAHTDAEYETDVLHRQEEFGDCADLEPLARTASQRRYDAFVAIFLKAAGTTEQTTQVPLVNIICDEDTARAAVHNYFGYPSPADPPTSDRIRWCQTIDGAPVDLTDLAIALLIGNIRRVVVDSAGRAVDLGRKSRIFTGAAREAVLQMGRRYSHPGCEHRLGIQIDHLNPWVRGAGVTNPLNGGPVCGKHNRDKHHHHIRVIRNDTGWHHYRPDGTEICPRTSAA